MSTNPSGSRAASAASSSSSPDVTGPLYLSVKAAAERLHISPLTLREHVRDGKVKAYKFGTRTIRLRVEDVDAMITPYFPEDDAESGASA